jgi:hypothetical protein
MVSERKMLTLKRTISNMLLSEIKMLSELPILMALWAFFHDFKRTKKYQISFLRLVTLKFEQIF